MRLLLTLLGLLLALPVMAQSPAFDPKNLKKAHAGPPTQVLTLGSSHLSQMEKLVTAEMLEPLLAKLAAFKPDIITHEGVSGEQCDQLRRYRKRYPDVWASYCRGTEAAEMTVGLSVAEAMDEVEKTLAAWPARPEPAQRRKLAATFLAAGDLPSALVQWLQLPVTERRVGDKIDPALLKLLNREGAKPNETYDIAAVLAARLGHQRVFAVDDHTADSILAAGPEFEAAIQAHFSKERRQYDTMKDLDKSARTGDDVLAYFRYLNLPVTQKMFVSSDFGEALRLESPQLFGRQYVAWYEARNLRMVANVRAAFGNRPGARVLNIVGASHKAYYDAYLDMMHEVKLVDALDVLK